MADATRYLTSFVPKLVEVTPRNAAAAIETANELIAAAPKCRRWTIQSVHFSGE